MTKGKLYELSYRATHTVFSEAELEELIDEAKKEFTHGGSDPNLKTVVEWFVKYFGDEK